MAVEELTLKKLMAVMKSIPPPPKLPRWEELTWAERNMMEQHIRAVENPMIREAMFAEYFRSERRQQASRRPTVSELETCTRACGYPHGGSVWQHGVTCWASRAINAENALAAAQATIAQRDDRLRVAQSEMRAHAGRADQLYADLMRSGKKVSALTDELIAATDRGNAWQTVAADLTERLCHEGERLAARDAQVAELTAALAAFQYVNRPDGMMCWCTPPVVAAHYPAHGWTCNQARKVIAGHIG